MEEEKKTISQLKLNVLLAKYIKKKSKGLKTYNKVLIPILSYINPQKTGLFFNEEWHYIDGFVPPDELIQKGLNETKCNGVYFGTHNSFCVLLYGKPIAEFNKLVRLIYKYSGVTINWDDIKTEFTQMFPDKDKYLCYDEQQCKIAIDFIKNNRSSKDNIFVTINTVGELVVRRALCISIVSPSGKEKASKTILV